MFISMEYIKGKELKDTVETHLPAGRQGRDASLQREEIIKIANCGRNLCLPWGEKDKAFQ
jgi:hypothetical protein